MDEDLAIQNHMNKLLGICIPTYNRADALRECLNSFIPWAKSNSFPIFIVDDCSTDDTENVILEARENYKDIIYYKNEKNIGMYLNILKVISVSDTKFVWLLGDDDLIINKNLNDILQYINSDYDFVVLNSVTYDPTMSVVLSEKVIDCDKNSVYLPGFHEKLLVDLSLWAYHGYMSAMIAKKEIFIGETAPYFNEDFPYFKNNWIPLIMFYRGIVGKKGIFRCEPLIKNRGDNRISRQTFWERSVIGHIRALESLREFGYSDSTLKEAVGLNFSQTIYFSTKAKQVSKDTILYNSYVKQSKIIKLNFKIITYFFDRVPYKLFKFVLKTFKKFKKK